MNINWSFFIRFTIIFYFFNSTNLALIILENVVKSLPFGSLPATRNLGTDFLSKLFESSKFSFLIKASSAGSFASCFNLTISNPSSAAYS